MNQSHTASAAKLQNKPTRNRTSLSPALIPLAVLGVSCVFSVVQRAAASITQSDKSSRFFGKMSADEAKKAAANLCTEITGSAVTATDTSRQCAYSWRRQTMVREWNVLCESSQGQYLVRINADSKRIYAINRMDTPEGKVTASQPTSTLTEPIIMTKTLAEERALKYLRIVGVPSQGLSEMEFTNPQFQPAGAKDAVPQWNFTYRRSVPGLGKRLLKVSVNGETGGLEHVWNPVYAL